MNRTQKTVPGGLYIRAEAGDVSLQAATADDGKTLRRFSMTAYTGGVMALVGWPYPVVVDLTGLDIGKNSRPILMNHNTARIVGHTVKVGVSGTALTVDGVISGVGSAAREVVGSSDNGFPWQASLGAMVKKVVFVPEGRKAAANGKEFAGPVYMVSQAKLGEVSFVALGADDATTAQVEAGRIPVINNSNREIMTMDFEKWIKAVFTDLTNDQIANIKAMFEADLTDDQIANIKAVFADLTDDQIANIKAMFEAETNGKQENRKKTGEANPSAAEAVIQAREEAQAAIRTERDRVSAVQEICGGEFPSVERDATRLGWTVEDTSQKVLKAMRENRPKADAHLGTRSDNGSAFTAQSLEASLCMRARIPEKTLVAEYGEQVVENAYGNREISLQNLLAECAELEGQTVPRTFGNDMIRAAFSTVALPGILNNVANKRLMRSFDAQSIVATRICSEGELNDFKESERYRLTDVGDLEPVAPDGELKHGGLREDKATNQLGTYGKIFSLTREMIYNDDLGAFLKVPEGMGARAARKIDQLFFTRLLANPTQGDGKALFHTDHKNLKVGTTTALSGDSLALAIQMFLDQTDADGQPINVSPKFLLVPTSLKMTARELLNSVTLFATGSTDKKRIPTYNALADEELEVVASPYLSNSNYTGASALAWYLFAEPAVVDTFEIGYLKGRTVPMVEQGETDFDRLGIKFRVYFDLGVREQDYRGMTMFKGEA